MDVPQGGDGTANANSQQVTGNIGVPGYQPQPSQVSNVIPDSARWSPQPQGGSDPDRDWAESFKGLQRRYQADVADVRQQQNQLNTQMGSLINQMGQILNVLTQSQQPSPASGGQAPRPAADPQPTSRPQDAQPTSQQAPVPDGNNEALRMAQQAQADTHKLRLLMQYSASGQPGEGIPLANLVDHIPTVPPVMKDGQLDDSGQRSAIESLINAIKSTSAKDAQQVAADTANGMTPGSSPGAAPSLNPVQTQYQRYEYLKGYVGSDPFMQLPEAEQEGMFNEFQELLGTVGFLDENMTPPGLTVDGLYRRFMMQGRDAMMQGKAPLPGGIA